MSNHKKIDWLRWHKRKYFIRINCFIMVCILLIVLLLQFPIVHAEEVQTIGDFYFCNDLLNKSIALSHNGESGFYDVHTNIFDSTSKLFVDNGMDYYDVVKDIFENPTAVSDIRNYDIFFGTNSNTGIAIVKSSDGNISLMTNVGHVSVDYDSNYIFRQPSSYYGSPIYRFDWNGSHLVYNTTYNGGSYTSCQNIDGFIYASCPIMMYYPNRDQNLNYVQIENNAGWGSGGFNVSAPDNSVQEHKKAYKGSTMYLKTSNLNNGALNIVLKSDNVQKQNAKVILRCNVSTTVQHNATATYNLSADNGAFADNYNTPDNNFSIGTYSEYEIPVSAFSNDGLFSINLATLNQGLWNNNEKSLYHFNQNFENQSTYASYTITSAIFYILTIANAQWDYSRLSNFDYSLLSEVYDCSATLSINGNEERFASFQYDMVSGSLTEQDYDLPDENDVKDVLDVDVVPNDYIPTPQKPNYPDAYNVTVPNTPSNNDNNDTNNNNVAPTNNNNVTNGDYSPSVVNNNNVTVEQGNRYPERGVMNAFVRIINNDKNNTVNDIDNMIGGNAYIQLCNHALSSVPNQVWQLWITCLKAILGILVSAFFLKILINWST